MRFIPLDGLVWSDERGWGLRPLEAAGIVPEDVGEARVVSVKPGAVRGNHRFGAPVTLAWRAEGDEAQSVVVDGGTPVLAEFPPGVAHTIRGEGPGTAFLVSWADGVPTTERVPPLL